MTIEQRIDEMRGIAISASHPISLSFFDRRNRKTTKLIGNADESRYIKSQNRRYEFELAKPVFIRTISFSAVDFSKSDKARFEYRLASGGHEQTTLTPNQNGAFVVRINQFVKQFALTPPKKFLGKQLLTNVTVSGYLPREFSEVADLVGKIEEYRQEIIEDSERRLADVKEKEQRLALLAEKKEELIDEIKSLEAEVQSEKGLHEAAIEKRVEAQSGVEELRNRLKELAGKIEASENTLEKNRGERESLNREIQEANQELKRLQDDINLFPTEISAFVKQGAENIRRYTFLSLIPIVVIAGVMVALFNNAADLTYLHKTDPDYSVWSVLLTRIPYVLVCAALVGASYKIVKIFIAEIIRINTQRLNLSKVSIIAKDVSQSGEDGLDLTDLERAELRNHTKMELLRAHLKTYLGDDFVYKPKRTRPVPSTQPSPGDPGDDESD